MRDQDTGKSLMAGWKSRSSCWPVEIPSKNWMVAHSVSLFRSAYVYQVYNSNWSYFRAKVFESLDFTVQPLSGDSEQALNPPPVDPSSSLGRRSRAKLLRAWVEISTWLALYLKSKPSELLVTFYIHTLMSVCRGYGRIPVSSLERERTECNRNDPVCYWSTS